MYAIQGLSQCKQKYKNVILEFKSYVLNCSFHISLGSPFYHSPSNKTTQIFKFNELINK